MFRILTALTIICIATTTVSAQKGGGGGGGRPGGGSPGGGGGHPPPAGGGHPPPHNGGGYHGGYYGYRGYPYYGGFYSPFYLGFGFGPAYSYDYAPYSSLHIPQPYVVAPPVALAPPQPIAFIDVSVPTADAEVWLGSSSTTSKGLTRHYESPPLEPGQNYTYTITAKWLVDGKPVEESRDVSVSAGKTSSVDFRQPRRELIPLPQKKP